MALRNAMRSAACLFVFVVISGHPDGAGQTTVEGDRAVSTARMKGSIAVRCEAVRHATGATLGFRIEILNGDRAKALVVAVHQDIGRNARFVLCNEAGLPVSPMAEGVPAVNRDGPETLTDDRVCGTIPPQTSHSWFLPVPRLVRSDPRRLENEGNLVSILAGAYTAVAVVSLDYVFVEGGRETTLEQAQWQRIRLLKLPSMAIVVDPALLTEDVLEAYAQSCGAGPKQKGEGDP